MTHSDCIFCRIAAGEAPCDLVAENEKYMAFLDHQPIGVGHTLVIPKAHYVTLTDVPEPELGDYLKLIQMVAKTLITELDVPGFNLFQNNHAVAGQVVFHVHFHVVPRYQGDGLRYRRFLKPQSKSAQSELAERFRQRHSNLWGAA